MSKRRQTTGMPTSKRKSAAPDTENASWLDNLLGNPTTRAEREDAINRLIIRTLVITGVVIGVVLGIALIYDQVIVPGQTVATINGETVTVREFRERVRFERARLTQELNTVIAQAQNVGFDPNQLLQQEPYRTWLNEVNFPDALGQRVLNDIVDDYLIRQQASELNVSVDESIIESEVNEFFGYDPTQVALIGAEPTATVTPTITPTPFVSPTPSPEPTATLEPTEAPESTEEAEVTEEPTAFPTLEPTATPEAEVRQTQAAEQFEQNRNSFRDFISFEAGLGADQIDAYFERLALRNAVSDAVTEDVTTAPYVNARHILVDTEATANEVIAALENGESFSDLARALSTDTGSGARGGELGWSPVTNYVEPFADAVRELPIGEISEPVQSEFGFHIIQVRAREEREVSENELQQVRSRLFGEWLDSLRDSNEENITLSDNWTDYVPR